MKWLITNVALLICMSCNRDTVNHIGKYEGYYVETHHRLHLHSNNTYKYVTEGHFGDSESIGSYSIINDTIELQSNKPIAFGKYYLLTQNNCLLNLETHAPVCKDQQNLELVNLNVNYPQTEAKSEKQINDLEKMMGQSLRHPDLVDYYSNREQVLIKNYFQLSKTIQTDNLLLNSTTKFINENEINHDTEYLIVSEIRIGMETAMISIRKHDEYGGHLTFFHKVDGNWELKPRILLK